MENSILLNLSKDEKKLLEVKSLKKNEILFREGENCESVSIVVSGEVKISTISFEGQELIYNILQKNDVFGNNLIFSDEPFYKGDVIATKDSTIVIIKRENLILLLQSNKEFMIAYLNTQSNFSKKLNSTIKLLSYSSAEERLRFYLFNNNGKIQYKSVSELASILHLQRETLSRLLTKLEKENVIKRSLHQIVLLD
ncbi:MAG: Crp/Fnr family transcriptional regulator [Firmicutes bacterium]|nr:Crp/Fnr family transcriptional regulator [Candidatus Fiminaster equi]